MKNVVYAIVAISLTTLTATNVQAQVPSPAGIHSVWSKSALQLEDPKTGAIYRQFTSSNGAIAWKESLSSVVPPAWSTFFDAVVVPAAPIEVWYEFRLVNVKKTSATEIQGTWMISRNGTIQTRNCQGSAYGLDLGGSATPYFKLTCLDPAAPSDRAWLLVANITDHYDF